LGQPTLTKEETFAAGAVSGAAFAMEKAVFTQLGGFAELFFMYFEDTDLSLRLYHFGYHILVVPASRVHHAYEANFSANKVFYLERNRYLSILGLLPWRWLVLMFPALLWTELVSWGYAFLQGKTAVKAKAKSWQAIWQRRHWIQQRRQQYANPQTAVPLIQNVFTARLEASYTTEQQALSKIVEWVAWLTAAPFLKIAQILAK
jgi:GT2 family glycosyltransferase